MMEKEHRFENQKQQLLGCLSPQLRAVIPPHPGKVLQPDLDKTAAEPLAICNFYHYDEEA